jgi:hypothetical protein
MGFFVYKDFRASQLYTMLQQRYKDEIVSQSANGYITEIGDHYIVRNGVKEEFEKAVSTIPLNALLKIMGRKCDLRYLESHYVHMQTRSLNFEGSSQVMTVDNIFSFYKTTILAEDRYLFHMHQDVPNAGAYFMPIIADFELLEGTKIAEAIPLGPMPDLKWLEESDIFPVGSYAQHDWCADVGSNFLRLLKYSGRGDKSVGPRIILPRR